MRITPGANMLSDVALARFYRAVEVVVAPGYDGYTGSPSDIALLRIVGVSNDMPRIPILKMPQDQLKTGTEVTLIGYGVTGGAVDDSGFRRTTRQVVAWESAQFIGLDQTSGHGLCEGDSGGPVLALVGGAPAVAGVNSFTAGGCAKKATSIRVAPFADLIAAAVSSIPHAQDCAACMNATMAPGNSC